MLHFYSQGTASFQELYHLEIHSLFCNFPVLAVQTFYDVCSIHDSANISGKLEERTHIFPVIFPVADRIGIFLPPFFLNRFQFRKSCRFIGRIIDSLEICGKFLQIVIIHIFKGITQHMDYTALDLCLGKTAWIASLNPGRPSTQKNRTSCTPRFFRSLSIPARIYWFHSLPQ